MTAEDAGRIEQAAIVLLHAVKVAGVGSEHARAALKWLPSHGSVDLSAARELLEEPTAWNAEKEGA